MAAKTQSTASFVVRFTQNILKDTEGESEVHWRGKISHVQGGDDSNFTDFGDAVEFMQEKLSQMTKEATGDKTESEQENILAKSFDIWRKFAKASPKFVMETIKDPRAKVSQIQDQISEVGDEISQKIEIDSWKVATKNDFKTLVEKMEKMNASIEQIQKSLKKLPKK